MSRSQDPSNTFLFPGKTKGYSKRPQMKSCKRKKHPVWVMVHAGPWQNLSRDTVVPLAMDGLCKGMGLEKEAQFGIATRLLLMHN